MKYLIPAEWLKMRKRWMPRILVAVMLIIIALIFWGIGTSSNRINLLMPRGWIRALFLASSFAPFLWPVLGGNWSGSEYGWGTARLVLSRRPDRVNWVISALIVLILTTGLALLAVLIVAALGGIVAALLTNRSIFFTTALQSNYFLLVVKSFLGAWYIFSFFVILSYAAGSIFRSSSAGIGIGIGINVAQLIVFGIFDGLGGTWKTVADHFPYAYTQGLPGQLAASGTVGNFARGQRGRASITEDIIGLAIYMAILIAITLFLVRNRDVTA